MTEQSGYVHNDRVSKKAQLLGAVKKEKER